MNLLIHTFLDQTPAGLFDRSDSDGLGRFEWLPGFDRHWLNPFSDEDVTVATFQADRELPGIFSDYLPGHFAKTLLKEALRGSNRSVESLSTLAWLSLTADRGMGAFRFEPAGFPELTAVEPVDLDKIVRYAHQVYQGRGSELSDRRLRELLRAGLFVRGRSPKILVAVNDFTGEVLSGQSSLRNGFQGWIVKLDGIVEGTSERLSLEYEFAKKAASCGIQTAAVRMMKDAGWKHLMIKRFDREKGAKQRMVQCPSYITGWEEVFRLMRQARLPYPDMDEMFRRMVFSILTKDDGFGPSKICFVHSQKEGWRLAPAFNLKPSSASEGSFLNGKSQIDAWTAEKLVHFGERVNVRKSAKMVDQLSSILL